MQSGARGNPFENKDHCYRNSRKMAEEDQPLNNNNDTNAPSIGPLVPPPKGISGGYKAVSLPFLSCLRTNLCCKIGYNVGMIARQPLLKEKVPIHFGPRPDSWSLGIRIEGIEYLTSELINLIRPMVRVHVVHIEHGTYLRSQKRAFVAPLTTSSYPLKDSSDCPNWQQDLVLDINYGDIVSEDALILFELLDNRPSLNVKKTARNQGLRPPKQIAWGYIRPVSVSGNLNVGVRDDWYQPPVKEAASSSRNLRKNNKRASQKGGTAGGGGVGSGTENEENDGGRANRRSRNSRRGGNRGRGRGGDADDPPSQPEDDDDSNDDEDDNDDDDEHRNEVESNDPPARLLQTHHLTPPPPQHTLSHSDTSSQSSFHTTGTTQQPRRRQQQTPTKTWRSSEQPRHIFSVESPPSHSGAAESTDTIVCLHAVGRMDGEHTAANDGMAFFETSDGPKNPVGSVLLS